MVPNAPQDDVTSVQQLANYKTSRNLALLFLVFVCPHLSQAQQDIA